MDNSKTENDKIKKITVEVKKWHHVGNTYFSTIATVNFESGKTINVGINYEYGYELHYLFSIFEKMAKMGILSNFDTKHPAPNRYCHDYKIELKVIDHGYVSKQEMKNFKVT